jgi:hypothetical protein
MVFRAETVRETAFVKLGRFMKSGIETDRPRAFPLEQDLAWYNGIMWHIKVSNVRNETTGSRTLAVSRVPCSAGAVPDASTTSALVECQGLLEQRLRSGPVARRSDCELGNSAGQIVLIRQVGSAPIESVTKIRLR